jgi:hypothetical protein
MSRYGPWTIMSKRLINHITKPHIPNPPSVYSISFAIRSMDLISLWATFLKGFMKVKTPGRCLTGCLIMMEIPRDMKGFVKSATCVLRC